MFLVTWETLNGNVRSRKFADGNCAEAFREHMESLSGTQWVDIDQIEDES